MSTVSQSANSANSRGSSLASPAEKTGGTVERLGLPVPHCLTGDQLETSIISSSEDLLHFQLLRRHPLVSLGPAASSLWVQLLLIFIFNLVVSSPRRLFGFKLRHDENRKHISVFSDTWLFCFYFLFVFISWN